MADAIETMPFDAAELKPCRCCGKGIMHTGSPVFYELTMRSCVIDIKNVQRMHGLEMMMGGNVPLARVFSPSNTVAQRLPLVRHLLCSECAAKTILPLAFIEEAQIDD